jgi:hypothetical protein
MENLSAVTLFRLVHVVAGVFWAGTVLFLAGFLVPTLRAIGPVGAPVMQQLAGPRRLPVYLMGSAILTVLSGVALYWRDSDGFRSSWLGSGAGITFGLGGALAIVAMVLGIAINIPTARRMGALGEAIRAGGKPATTEQAATLQQLQSRLEGGGKVVAVLVGLATIAMAIARYVS